MSCVIEQTSSEGSYPKLTIELLVVWTSNARCLLSPGCLSEGRKEKLIQVFQQCTVMRFKQLQSMYLGENLVQQTIPQMKADIKKKFETSLRPKVALEGYGSGQVYTKRL